MLKSKSTPFLPIIYENQQKKEETNYNTNMGNYGFYDKLFNPETKIRNFKFNQTNIII